MTILQKTLPFDAPAERARVTFTGRTFDVAEPILAAHDAANPGFCERACEFIRDYLRTHGRSAGEVIVAAGTEAGIVARDSSAWDQRRARVVTGQPIGVASMSTNDVPGANPKNADKLATGCWAEHADGSLLFVKGTEGGQIVYELYDVAQTPPVYYQDAMREDAFKKAFSAPPVGQSAEEWTWHDKTPFPWTRVMKTFDKPVPTPADVHDTLSAAARVAESLRLRAQKLSAEALQPQVEQRTRKGRAIADRISRALEVLLGDEE